MRHACAALALLIAAGPCLGAPLADGGRPRPEAACAAFDLHLLGQIEEAGFWTSIEAERLFGVVERIVQARRLCSAGRTAEALGLYEAIDIAGVDVTWLR